MTGLELFPKAKAARPDVPVIVITAYGDAGNQAQGIRGRRRGAFTGPSLSISERFAMKLMQGLSGRRNQINTFSRIVSAISALALSGHKEALIRG